MQDEDQPQQALPTPHLVQAPQQPKQKQRDIRKPQHDNHGQRNHDQESDLKAIRSFVIEIRDQVDVLTDQSRVLADMVADLKKSKTDGVGALDNRLAQVLDAVVEGQENTRQVLRLVALDPKALPKLRAASEKLTGQETSIAAKSGPGAGWFVLFTALAVIAFVVLLRL
jgi:hypothetical protein